MDQSKHYEKNFLVAKLEKLHVAAVFSDLHNDRFQF